MKKIDWLIATFYFEHDIGFNVYNGQNNSCQGVFKKIHENALKFHLIFS